jgi:hypothetical protein
MLTREQTLEFLMDRDGGTRDVTFTPVTRKSLGDFLKLLLASYTVCTAHDNDGEDVAFQLRESELDSVLDREAGTLHVTLSNPSAVIRNLGVLIDWATGKATYCVEVYFFPDAVDPIAFTLEWFVALLKAWNDQLRADDYFVRYENASWELYDAGGLGVIFTSKHLPEGMS